MSKLAASGPRRTGERQGEARHGRKEKGGAATVFRVRRGVAMGRVAGGDSRRGDRSSEARSGGIMDFSPNMDTSSLAIPSKLHRETLCNKISFSPHS